MTRAAIALGSNLGDRPAHLALAVDALGRLGEVLARSSIYETAPIGGPEQGPYLNGVVVLETDLSPRELLDALVAIEQNAGRVRDVRFGPRTIDLDLIVYEGIELAEPGLTVPHPRAAERRFVLEPLVEVWPAARLAGGLVASEALASVADQQVALYRPDRGQAWVTAQMALLAVWGIALVVDKGGFRGSTVVGALLLAAGLGLVLWAVRSLGSSLTPYPEPRHRGRLVEEGAYGRARHPIYGGLLLGSTGLALWLGSRPALVVVAALAVLWFAKASEEERRLLARFPSYRAYRARVRKRFIPWVI